MIMQPRAGIVAERYATKALVKAARSGAPLARRQRRAQPWEARPPHAGPHWYGAGSDRLSARRRCTGAVFLALDCPARGHRV